MLRFIGRQKEKAGLLGLLNKKSPSLVVIRGRRRIGKSRLAEEFSSSFSTAYMLTGLPPTPELTAQDQRNEFARQMRRQKITTTSVDDWGDLFTDLAQQALKGRVLIVLDEITWMGDKDPTFLPKLKTIWDTQFKKNPQLILLISGSNSSWIEKNILSSTGFVGRISYQLHLKELPLYRCDEFWQDPQHQIDAYEKFKVLSITGGVPRYLEEVRSDLSAEQNIFALCYQSTGILFHEFDQIFSDLFAHRNRMYKKIILQLVNNDLNMSEIAEKLGRSKGSELNDYLDELVEAGFLARNPLWNIGKEREERLNYYRICDNYVRFYLKYIEPYKSRIENDTLKGLPKGWKSIMGLQFENLISQNAVSLYKELGLALDEIVWSGPYLQRATTRRRGCQIDYLIQSKHRVLYACEIKFSERPIPTSVMRDMAEKSKCLYLPRGFSLRHVLIHVNGVSEKVEYDDFFSNIIDFRKFIEYEVDL